MNIYRLWEQVMPAEKRWLGVIICGSLLLHLLGLFIFDVRQPDAGIIPLRPRQASLMVPGAGWSGLMQIDHHLWLQWQDPSAIAMPRSPLPDVPKLKESLSQNLEWKLPEEIQSPEEIILGKGESLERSLEEALKPARATPEFSPVTTPPALSGSSVEFQGTLKQREVVSEGKLPRPSTSESLQVTILMVGVRPDGRVDSVFVEESCRDASIDQLGSRAIRSWRFEKTPESSGIQFGRAVIYWDFKAQENQPASSSEGYSF
ncbi:MAG: hypothetical protein AAFY98_03955 [Verrucomicrobiota bacterium]